MLRALRSKLWPTAHQFELLQTELRRELDELRGMVTELRTMANDLPVMRAAIDDAVNRARQRGDWQAELRTRLRRTQALTARVYETLQGWSPQLADARRDPAYELAYEDPDPLITVAVTTYHSPDTLCQRALASVRAQTHQNWEAIVVGDHCTDDTEQRVRELGDERIRFHNLPVREHDPEDPWEEWAVRGSVPRSVAIAMARGRWIAPLSHDDQWDPDHLETLLAAARESHGELVYSRMRVVDGDDPQAGPVRSCGAWPPRLGEYNCQASLFHGLLRFLRYDRAAALASEPNDWNLARRAWEAGVRFYFVDRETATLFEYPRWRSIHERYAALGMPPTAIASP